MSSNELSKVSGVDQDLCEGGIILYEGGSFSRELDIPLLLSKNKEK